MSKMIKLLWKAPNVAIAQRGPRYLENLNREGKTEFFAPEMDEQGNITYEVDEEYGRRLLAGQGDRFHLLSPAELIIKRRRKDLLGSEYVKVKAIGALPDLQIPPVELATPQETLTAMEPAQTPQDGQEAAPDLQTAAQEGRKGRRPPATA